MVISHSPFFYTTETVSLRHSWQASEKWCKNHFITRRASYIVVANVSNFKRSPTSSHGIFSFHRIKYTFCPILPSPHTLSPSFRSIQMNLWRWSEKALVWWNGSTSRPHSIHQRYGRLYFSFVGWFFGGGIRFEWVAATPTFVPSLSFAYLIRHWKIFSWTTRYVMAANSTMGADGTDPSISGNWRTRLNFLTAGGWPASRWVSIKIPLRFYAMLTWIFPPLFFCFFGVWRQFTFCQSKKTYILLALCQSFISSAACPDGIW